MMAVEEVDALNVQRAEYAAIQEFQADEIGRGRTRVSDDRV